MGRRRTVVTVLVALGLVLGLTGCEVYRDETTNPLGTVTFVKECSPARVTVTVENVSDEPLDVHISADAITLASRTGLAPGHVVVGASSFDATQAQATLTVGGSGYLPTRPLPTCGE